MCVCSIATEAALPFERETKKKHFGKWMCQVSTGAIVFVNPNEG